jgi:hypothetical protein
MFSYLNTHFIFSHVGRGAFCEAPYKEFILHGAITSDKFQARTYCFRPGIMNWQLWRSGGRTSVFLSTTLVGMWVSVLSGSVGVTTICFHL